MHSEQEYYCGRIGKAKGDVIANPDKHIPYFVPAIQNGRTPFQVAAVKLRGELEADELTLREYWFRRVKCEIGCRDRRGFSACLTRCLLDGKM